MAGTFDQSFYPANQRVVLLTFATPAAAEEWDRAGQPIAVDLTPADPARVDLDIQPDDPDVTRLLTLRNLIAQAVANMPDQPTPSWPDADPPTAATVTWPAPTGPAETAQQRRERP